MTTPTRSSSPSSKALRVRLVDAEVATDILPGLAALLADAVDTGASLGFWAPLRPSRALAYWHDVRAEVEGGGVLLLVAEADGSASATTYYYRHLA